MKSLAVALSRVVCLLAVWSPAAPTGPGSALAGAPAGPSNSPPVALRAESFTVPPSSRSLVYVDVKNLRDVRYQGSLAVKLPEGWRLARSRQPLVIEPGETQRVRFTVERGLSLKSNSYPVEVSATGAGVTVVRKQDVACASAPYFKPTIDGDPSEWKHAVPVAFTTGGKKTVISTYWNRRQFSILVAVEEQKLIGYTAGPTPNEFDAVQVAVSPQGATTADSPDLPSVGHEHAPPNGRAARFEFLFVSAGGGTSGKCFQLAAPGVKLAETAKSRRLEPLLYEGATVAVSRTGAVTYYECSIPLSPMRQAIRPSEGREFCLSVLVHDPDGTGIRDWGSAAGLWPWQRTPWAWSRWAGAEWGNKPPFDNKLQWGMCSSTY